MLKNLITDVPGISVGHQTIQGGTSQTGVTAIIPHQENVFRQKLAAAVHVVNGFGKSAGTIQIEELGTLETPIILTNTFGVGTAVNALIHDSLERNPEIGNITGTVNPLVFECNDGELNDIRAMAVKEADILTAMAAAGENFQEGAVGAGTGMRCYQLKGGIGSTSRQVTFAGKTFHLGCLVLTNYGQLADLVIDGYKIGAEIAEFYSLKDKAKKEQGSVIVVLATDIPMNSRQLKRISKRASVGITRTGAFIGNGSGEIVLSFSTAQRMNHFEEKPFVMHQLFNENYIDEIFQTVAEMVDEAVLHSLVFSQPAVSREGKPIRNLLECVEEIQTRHYSTERAALLKRLSQIKNR